MSFHSKFGSIGAKTSPRINQQKVDDAVKELLTAGEKITVDSVRSKIGSGSLTTISKMLREFDRVKHNLICKGGELVGDAGSTYLISRNFLQVGDDEVCSVVLNGLHLLINKKEAQRVICDSENKLAGGAITEFAGEFLISINVIDSIKFTAGNEFVEQFVRDLKIAGA